MLLPLDVSMSQKLEIFACNPGLLEVSITSKPTLLDATKVYKGIELRNYAVKWHCALM